MGRRPSEDGDRDWSYAGASQGTPSDTSRYQELEEARNIARPPSPPLETPGVQLCQCSDFEFGGSKTMRGWISVVRGQLDSSHLLAAPGN